MNDSKRYLKKIRAILPVWGSYEKRFYKDIRSNVTEFCRHIRIILILISSMSSLHRKKSSVITLPVLLLTIFPANFLLPST